VLADDHDNLGDAALASSLRALSSGEGQSIGDGAASATPGGLVVSPFSTRASLTGLVEGARRHLLLVTELFDDAALASLLAKQASAGVKVMMLLSAADAIPVEQATLLARAGVDVRVQKQPYLHAKAVLADDSRYLVGSPNLTRASLEVNRELGLRGEDPEVATRLAATLGNDADRAHRWSPP
jgi:phosphatidylserine/phosphatidylglycerophosphate/cardiolipin synthase-like enzyme